LVDKRSKCQKSNSLNYTWEAVERDFSGFLGFLYQNDSFFLFLGKFLDKRFKKYSFVG
jgi:hypothetical protein